MKSLSIVVVFAVLLVQGCATVPSKQVAQPWIRTLQSKQIIELTKKLKIDVTGATEPLIGDETLLEESLKSTLSRLIERRGFTIDDSRYDYLMKMSYLTESNIAYSNILPNTSTNISNISYSIEPSYGMSSGLGISIARALAITYEEPIYQYKHVIALEILDKQGNLLWKGESTWDSNTLNLINRIIPALQLLLSDLPKDNTYRPRVFEVKETHVSNYFRLECKDSWFVCPALPYKISFKGGGPYISNVTGALKTIKSQNALAAYVDLIQTAEYALPDGNEKDWLNPLDTELWRKVTLGGKYLLGTTEKPINILIYLSGKSDGYYIDECKVVSDTEFKEFDRKFKSWHTVLAQFYDVFKD